MAFDMKDGAELAASHGFTQCAHRRPKAPVVSDCEHHAGIAAGPEHESRVGAGERQRLFAEHLLVGRGARDHLRRMQ